MEDLITLWSKKVLDHQNISDEFKIKFFQELFGEELNEENVEHAFKVWRGSSIPSANVRRVKYDDVTREMVIEFQDKSIYTYFNVPFDVFLGVTNGDATCTTTGQNRWGSWEDGKSPSVGSAVWKYLIRSNIKYQRGGNLK